MIVMMHREFNLHEIFWDSQIFQEFSNSLNFFELLFKENPFVKYKFHLDYKK